MFKTFGFFGFGRGTGETPVPTAVDVQLSGPLAIFQEEEATYTYLGPLPESGTTYQWYVADDAIGTNATPISGATSLTFTPVDAQGQKYLRIGVTPSDGITTGVEAFSPWEGPVWSVASLFANGEAGFYTNCDPALGKCFTTSAGSTLAANPGDPIGRIEAINGVLTLTQSSSALRPVLARVPKGVGVVNRFTSATETFTTRNFTTSAVQYTLSAEGTGTITLTGTSIAGPLVLTGSRSSLTFTPTAGTLTLTVSGTISKAQIQLGASATPYQNVVAPYDITQDGIEDSWYAYGNGTQWMTFGVSTFGSAGLYAAAGQEWTSQVVFSTLLRQSLTYVLGKSGSASPNLTYAIMTQDNGVMRHRLRNANNSTGSPYDNGAPHSTTTRWTGSVATGYYDQNTYALSVGTNDNTTENISIMCRTPTAPAAIYTGFVVPFLIDRALTDQELINLGAVNAEIYGVAA